MDEREQISGIQEGQEMVLVLVAAPIWFIVYCQDNGFSSKSAALKSICSAQRAPREAVTVINII